MCIQTDPYFAISLYFTDERWIASQHIFSSMFSVNQLLKLENFHYIYET